MKWVNYGQHDAANQKYSALFLLSANKKCFVMRIFVRRHLTEFRQFPLKVTLEESSSLNERYLYGGFIVEFFTYFRQTGRK